MPHAQIGGLMLVQHSLSTDSIDAGDHPRHALVHCGALLLHRFPRRYACQVGQTYTSEAAGGKRFTPCRRPPSTHKHWRGGNADRMHHIRAALQAVHGPSTPHGSKSCALLELCTTRRASSKRLSAKRPIVKCLKY